MTRPPPRSTLTATLLPRTTLFQSNRRPVPCQPATAAALPAADLAPPGGLGCAAAQGWTGGEADLRKSGKRERASASWQFSRLVRGRRRKRRQLGKQIGRAHV